MMITLIAAAALAAQTAPVGHVHARPVQQGQMAEQPTMDCKQMMADCKKCCEEMKGKNADSSDNSKQVH